MRIEQKVQVKFTILNNSGCRGRERRQKREEESGRRSKLLLKGRWGGEEAGEVKWWQRSRSKVVTGARETEKKERKIGEAKWAAFKRRMGGGGRRSKVVTGARGGRLNLQ